jgi:hypothetical protein
MYNCDFKTIYNETEKEFIGHNLLEFGQAKDGFGLFAKATSSLTAGTVYVLPTGVITTVSTNGAVKGYLEVDVAGSESAPLYIFVRTFGKNGNGDFVVPEVISGQQS